MTDINEKSESQGQRNSSLQSKKKVNKKTLDTFFPSMWLLVLMVGIVLAFNIIVGMKVFSLEKEKAVIEILKARYESYEKIIGEVVEKEERLMTLTQQIVPLEKRKDNAEKAIADSDTKVDKNKKELNKIKAVESEINEKLNAAQVISAELSNDKKNLRKEVSQLKKIVAELKIDEKRTELKIREKRLNLRTLEENIVASKIRLKDQQKYIEDVASANSDFEKIRTKLAKFVKEMDETQLNAISKVKDLTEIVQEVATEKELLAAQTEKLTIEANSFSRSNATMSAKIDELNAHNIGYKAEVDKVATTSEKIKYATEAIKASATRLETNEILVNKNARTLKNTVMLAETTNKELIQSSKQFVEVVAGVSSQRARLDITLKDISDLPDMNKQVVAFDSILKELESFTHLLSKKGSSIQNDFDVKLNGMVLSFDPIAKDLNELSLKIDAVDQALQKIATQIQEIKKENPQI